MISVITVLKTFSLLSVSYPPILFTLQHWQNGDHLMSSVFSWQWSKQHKLEMHSKMSAWENECIRYLRLLFFPSSILVFICPTDWVIWQSIPIRQSCLWHYPLVTWLPTLHPDGVCLCCSVLTFRLFLCPSETWLVHQYYSDGKKEKCRSLTLRFISCSTALLKKNLNFKFIFYMNCWLLFCFAYCVTSVNKTK